VSEQDYMEQTTSPIQDAIFAALDKQHQQQREQGAYERGRKAKWARADRERREFVQHCRPARAAEYADWLAGYLSRGGALTHVYDYPFKQRGVRVVDGDIATGLHTEVADARWWVMESPPNWVPSLYGASSFQVIIPASVGFRRGDVPNTFHGGCGHSGFYFMTGYVEVGGWVPLYTDVRAILADR